MLNRTLSANLLGLNLGTRTLANLDLAQRNIVTAQRPFHAHPLKRKDSMRGGEAKAEEASISIRGSFAFAPSPSSPSGSPGRPYPGCPSRSRSEVVVVVGRSVPPVRATVAAPSQLQAQQGACGWRRATMTRAETIPAAVLSAAGG